MSSFKADQRYTNQYDEHHSTPDTSSSDELDDLPRQLFCVRKSWLGENEEALEQLYMDYVTLGTKVFGSAFHQLGDFTHFIKFVFKYMQPGAT